MEVAPLQKNLSPTVADDEGSLGSSFGVPSHQGDVPMRARLSTQLLPRRFRASAADDFSPFSSCHEGQHGVVLGERALGATPCQPGPSAGVSCPC